MTTPPTTTPPASRHFIIVTAAALALGGALLPIAPELTIALMALLAAYSLVVIARHAVFWLKHRPMPQHYDNKGRLQPNRIESFLLAAFALWPAWFYLALEIPLWLCAVFAVPLYFLGKLALFRWWLPHKQRQESQL